MSMIFVSYARVDSDFVLEIVKKLKQNNVNVWLDQHEIQLGQRWDLEVSKALRHATHILFISSQHSVESVNVLDEIHYALEANKTIIPILIDNAEKYFRVSRFQHIDFQGDDERAFTELMTFLPRGTTEPVPVKQAETVTPEASHDPVTSLPEEIKKPDFDQPLPDIKGFTIEKIISRTGFSEIYVAHDEDGVKHILKRRLKDPVPAIDFSKLDIQHRGLSIPTVVYEDDDFVYEVAEYVEGWTLSEVIMLNVGKIRGSQLETWATELLTIVNVLHSHNPPIIHRDIKPDNILVKPDTHQLVLLDLSSAVFYDPDVTYKSLGTEGYAPLEQIEGKPTPASDLYAIAATLHRMNTGELPPRIIDRMLGNKTFTLYGGIGNSEIAFQQMADMDVNKRPVDGSLVMHMFGRRHYDPGQASDLSTNQSLKNKVDSDLIKRIIKGEDIRIDVKDIVLPNGKVIKTEIIEGPKIVVNV